MSNKSLIGVIVTAVAGAVFGTGCFLSGRESKTSDDNNAAADEYMNSVDNTDTDPDDDNSDDKD